LCENVSTMASLRIIYTNCVRWKIAEVPAGWMYPPAMSSDINQTGTFAFSGPTVWNEVVNFPEINISENFSKGNISKNLEDMTFIIFMRIRWYSWELC